MQVFESNITNGFKSVFLGRLILSALIMLSLVILLFYGGVGIHDFLYLYPFLVVLYATDHVLRRYDVFVKDFLFYRWTIVALILILTLFDMFLILLVKLAMEGFAYTVFVQVLFMAFGFMLANFYKNIRNKKALQNKR
jgi:hypothetical protein